MEHKKRYEYLDVAKCIAIFLVVLGHCILFLSNDFVENYSNDSLLYKTIIKFNMPIFFFISGIFISGILKKDIKTVFISKTQQLLKPYFVFGIIAVSLSLLYNISIIENIKDIIYHIRNWFLLEYWYVGTFFLSIIIFYISRKFIKDKYIADIIAVSTTMLIPRDTILCTNICNLYIFLILGDYLKNIITNNKYFTIPIIAFIIFISSIFFEVSNISVYDNIIDIHNIGTSILKYLFMVITGISGSIFLISTLKIIIENFPDWKIWKISSEYGQKSFYIYLLNRLPMVFIISPILGKFGSKITPPHLFSYCLAPIISLFIVLSSLYIVKYLDKKKLLP